MPWLPPRFVESKSATGSLMKLLQGVRRAKFTEPLVAHPAESVHPISHPGHYGDRDRKQDSEGDDEQHGWSPQSRRRISNLDRRQGNCLCACEHGIGHVKFGLSGELL